LQKLEKHHAGLLQKVILSGRKLPEPSLLRTLPHIHESLECLKHMAGELQQKTGNGFQ